MVQFHDGSMLGQQHFRAQNIKYKEQLLYAKNFPRSYKYKWSEFLLAR